MGEKNSWLPLSGPGIPEGTEVDTTTGTFRIRDQGPADGDDGFGSDREPRNPKVSPSAGAIALELSQVNYDG